MKSLSNSVNNVKSTNCGRCKKYAKAEGIDYCRQCLCAVIEKRVKKELSAQGSGISSNKTGYRLAIICDGKSSLQCVAAAYLAKKLCMPGFGLEIVSPASTSQVSKNEAVILAKCADELAAELVEALISPKARQQQPLPRLLQKQKPISAANIFKSVTEKELKLYANIKNLKYAEANGSWLRQKVLKLHEKYPGTIEALAKSGSRVKKLIDR